MAPGKKPLEFHAKRPWGPPPGVEGTDEDDDDDNDEAENGFSMEEVLRLGGTKVMALGYGRRGTEAWGVVLHHFFTIALYKIKVESSVFYGIALECRRSSHVVGVVYIIGTPSGRRGLTFLALTSWHQCFEPEWCWYLYYVLTEYMHMLTVYAKSSWNLHPDYGKGTVSKLLNT